MDYRYVRIPVPVLSILPTTFKFPFRYVISPEGSGRGLTEAAN